METIDIKGKPYVMVNERLEYFWSHEFFGHYSIETEFVELSEERCVMKATIKDENGKIKSTGHAYEKADSTFINKTSYIENCETSAVGRALGICGIGIKTSVASAEEVGNAIAQQEEPPEKKAEKKEPPKGLASDEQRNEIRKIATNYKMKDGIYFMNFMRFVSEKYPDYFIDGKINKIGAMWLTNEFGNVYDEYCVESKLV